MKIPTTKALAVCYSDVFDYPLTQEELGKWQVGLWHTGSSIRQIIIHQGLIIKKNGFYCLRGREKIINLRKKREEIAQEKILLTQKTAQVLQKIPFIKLIAITGALSMQNSDQDDDIDLLIVTKKNRLWLSRFLANLVLELLGKRRGWKDTEFGNKFCLNLFLDDANLRISTLEQNLYTAHEVCQIKPIYNTLQTYEKFCSENIWVKEYLPKVLSASLQKILHRPAQNDVAILKNNHATMLSLTLDLVEYFSFKFQYFYMKPKITREKVERGRAFFHPRDTTKIVLSEFAKRIFKQRD